jgi:hypothetical protein
MPPPIGARCDRYGVLAYGSATSGSRRDTTLGRSPV